MANRILEVLLQAKDDASATLGKVEARVGSLESGFRKLGGYLVGFASAATVGKFLEESVKEAADAERGIVRLGVAVQNAGGNFQTLSPVLETAVEKVRRLSVYTDDDLRAALTNLITVSGDVSGSVKNLGVVADFAAFKQIDLSEASFAVAKAMNGNTTAINKLGIEGKTADEVLGNLRATVGGFAEREAATFSGRIQQLNNQWREFKEAVGTAILGTDGATDSVVNLTDALVGLTNSITKNAPAIQAFLGGLLDGAQKIGATIEVIGNFAVMMGKTVSSFLAGAIASITGLIAVALEGLGKLTGNQRLVEWGQNLEQRTRQTWANIANTIQSGATDVAASWDHLTGKFSATAGAQVETAQRMEMRLLGLTKDGAAKRTHVSEEELAARKQIANDLKKELERIHTELAVKTLLVEGGLTEDMAKEQVRRRTMLQTATGAQRDDLLASYQKVDQANLLLAAGFNKALVPAVKETERVMGTLRDAADHVEPRLKTVDLRTQAASISLDDAARAGIGFGQALGLVDDKAAATLQNVTTLADSMMRVGAGDPSAILGAVGSLGGILASIFRGDSPEERARQDLIAKSNELLAENNQRVGDLIRLSSTGTQFAGVTGALQQLLGVSHGPVLGASFADVTSALASKGLTMGDFKKVAEDLGLGDVVAGFKPGGMLSRTVIQAILDQIAATEPTQFPQTYAGQVGRIESGVRIGAIGQGDIFGQLLGAIASGPGGANSAILDALKGADFSSMEGRTAAADALRALFNQLNDGSLAPAQLGGLTGSEFVDAITRLIEILTNADQAINAGGFNVAGIGGAVTPDQPTLDGNGPTIGPVPLPDLVASFGDLSQLGTEQVDYLASIDNRLGAVLSVWTDIDTGQIIQAAPAQVQVGDVYVTTAAPTAGETGQAVRAAILDAVDQALAESYRRTQLSQGNVTRTT